MLIVMVMVILCFGDCMVMVMGDGDGFLYCGMDVFFNCVCVTFSPRSVQVAKQRPLMCETARILACAIISGGAQENGRRGRRLHVFNL